MNEFRQDRITGDWVLISSGRKDRPNQFRRQSVVDAETPCPFCADRMMTPPIIASYGASLSADASSVTAPHAWQVCVVPNLYPVLDPPALAAPTLPSSPSTTPTHSPAMSDRRSMEFGSAEFGSTGRGGVKSARELESPQLQPREPARGMHEVVIESPDHATGVSGLSPQQVIWMLTAYVDRMNAMRGIGHVSCALPIKNWGPDAGASLEHSHSQIFGLPLVPSQLQRELASATQYWSEQRRCLFCAMLQEELQQQSRIVVQNDHFVAWCPFASRFEFEIWIAPRRHAARFEGTPIPQLIPLADLLRGVLIRLEKSLGVAAYNYFVHSTPFDIRSDDHYHWHIEIIPRISKAAAFEWGTGIHINTVSPEFAASEFRRAF